MGSNPTVTATVLSRDMVDEPVAAQGETDGSELEVRTRQHDWYASSRDDLVHARISGDVSLDGWVALAKTFLDSLGIDDQ